MIASLLMTFCAAFNPVRGSSVQRLDSSLTIDGKTIVVEQLLPAALGASCSYVVRNALRDTTIIPFPGAPYNVVLGALTPLGAMPPGFPTVKLGQSPESTRRFILKGVTAKWAVWADTLFATDTIQSIPELHKVSTRWKWSKIDTSVEWTAWLRQETIQWVRADRRLSRETSVSPLRYSYDPATGRRITGSVFPEPGRRLVFTPSGIHVVVVK